MYAVDLGRVDVVEVLITGGADVNITRWDMRSTLMHASQKGYTAVAALLLKAGAEVNIQDEVTVLSLVAIILIFL